jgi:hypothetical protein
MQFTRRDWRNRNRIKTSAGPKWLTIPVQVKGRYLQRIRDTEISSDTWAAEHWKSLELNYARAQAYSDVAPWLKSLYDTATMRSLSDINRHFLSAVCNRLGLRTRITDSADYDLEGEKSERLASICRQAGATSYISGPAARDYLDEEVFARQGIAVRWFDYSGYPEYPQLWGDFEHGVTVLDLLFNAGDDARRYLKETA